MNNKNKSSNYIPLKYAITGAVVIFIITIYMAMSFELGKKNIEKVNEPNTPDNLSQLQLEVFDIDTTRGVFLIYKFRDLEDEVLKKTRYLIDRGSLTSKVVAERFDKSVETAPYYSLLIDPKYAYLQSGSNVDGRFVPNDSYLDLKMSFSYYSGRLFQIQLYSGISNDEFIEQEKNTLKYWNTMSNNGILALLDIYSKKYNGWEKVLNSQNTYNYIYRKNELEILLEHNYYSVIVYYTDKKVANKIIETEKLEMQERMKKQNEGI